MEEIKYLDMENATLRLQLDSIEEYRQFFKQHFVALTALNFKRIYVKIFSKDLKDMINILRTVRLPLIIETDSSEDITFDIPDGIIVININSNLQINSAAREFQKRNGLSQDGIVGKNTFNKLFK